jgi:hypothetical protein
VAAGLTPDARAIIAGDAAATKAIASRARIFVFILFPIERVGSMGYESRVLNTSTIGLSTGESESTSLCRQNIQSRAIIPYSQQKRNRRVSPSIGLGDIYHRIPRIGET